MPFFPPLTAMLSSASTDVAKALISVRGWPAILKLLRDHNIEPTSDLGKNTTSLALLVINGFVDWYHAEDTLVARAFKDILKDIPSKYLELRWTEDGTTPTLATAPATMMPGNHNPVFDLAPDELAQFVACTLKMDQATRRRLHLLLIKLNATELKKLVSTGDNLAVLLDLLIPQAPPKPDRRPLGERIKTGLNGFADELADFLVPGMGR